MMIVKLGYIISFCILTRVYCVNLEYKTFRCRNGTYISDKLVGDGKKDCFNDGIDESFLSCHQSDDGENCRPLAFFYSGFKFINNGCRSVTGRCNTIKDCSDGSDRDENNCGDEVNTEDCSRNKGKYLCTDKLRCLDLNYTCDGFCNCFDCSDEKNGCSQDGDLANITNESSHKVCFQTLNETVCCSKNNTVCQECESNNICDHKCVQFGNQRGCICDENYVGLPGTQNSKCQLNNSVTRETLLLYSTPHVINGTNLISNEHFSVEMIDNQRDYNLTAITAFQNYVYYATREEQPFHRENAYPYLYNNETLLGYSYRPTTAACIYKTSLLSNEIHEVAKLPFDDVEVTSLAVDWVTNNIYLTTELFLSVYSHDGSTYKDLKYGRMMNYINLASRFGLMFWSQPKQGGKFTDRAIMKSSMDGSDEKPLINLDLQYEVVTIDELSEKVYWYSSSHNIIESVNFNGEERKLEVLTDFPIYGPGIYFEGEIFFIHVSNKILSLNKTSKTRQLRLPVVKEVLYHNRFDNDGLRNFYVYNPVLQRVEIENPCPASCTGLCMTRPSLSKGVLNYTCWIENSKEALLAISDEGLSTTSLILIISAIVLIIALIIGILFYFKIRKRNASQSDRLTDDTG